MGEGCVASLNTSVPETGWRFPGGAALWGRLLLFWLQPGGLQRSEPVLGSSHSFPSPACAPPWGLGRQNIARTCFCSLQHQGLSVGLCPGRRSPGPCPRSLLHHRAHQQGHSSDFCIFSLCLSSSRQSSEQVLGNMRCLLWWRTLHIPCQGATGTASPAEPQVRARTCQSLCCCPPALNQPPQGLPSRLPAVCVCDSQPPGPPHLPLLGQNGLLGEKMLSTFLQSRDPIPEQFQWVTSTTALVEDLGRSMRSLCPLSAALCSCSRGSALLCHGDTKEHPVNSREGENDK